MEEMNEDWEDCCPLCMEEMDSTDRQLKPCRCGYQICVWCWNHIMEMAEKNSTEGRCPACRTAYDKEKIVSTAVRLSEIYDKKQKPGKAKSKAAEGRKNLSNVRVIQRNLVYVVGISAALADEETLERREYFGQYGKILKTSVSKTGGHSLQHSSATSSVSVYVTYVKEEDAMRCIQSVNGHVLDGKALKACFGTTKYCNAWLKHMPCNNPDCLYLHDEGTREDSFTKEDMLANYGSKNQQFHDLTHPSQRRLGIGLPPPVDTPFSSTTSVPLNVPTNPPTFVGSAPKTVPLIGNLPKSSSLPAPASWGSRPSPSQPGSGKIISSPATKHKTGACLINLATVSGNCSNRHSASNHEGTNYAKSRNTEGAQTSPSWAPRLLEKNHSSTETSLDFRTETFSSDADDALADPRQSFDGFLPGRKTLHTGEIKDSAFGTTKDMRLVDHVSSHILADAEESNGTEGSFSRLKNPMGLLTPLSIETNFVRQEDGSQFCGCLPSVECSSNLGLFPDSETSPLKSLEAHSAPEKNCGFQSASNAAVSLPAKVSGVNILLRQDHLSSEAHEGISCYKSSEDIQSRSLQSVNSDEPPFYSQNETVIEPEDLVLPQKAVCKSKTDDSDCVRKAPINGPSEHELISNMFSRDFDLWTDRRPQDLVHLLFDRKNVVFPSTSALQESATMGKSTSGSNQSRFHFARQDEINEQTFCSNKLNWRSRLDGQFFSEKYNKSPYENCLAGSTEVSVGTSSHRVISKSSMMAPPGFSAVRLSAVPPGFSQPKGRDLRRLSEVRQDLPQIVTLSSGFNHLEANNTIDVELIDPAIMAVGKGKLQSSSQIAAPFANNPLSALLSPTGPLTQQPMPILDFEPSYRAHQDDPYRNYGHSNQNLDASSSFVHSSFNEANNQSRLTGHCHDGILSHVAMPESVYANGIHGSQKLRFRHSSSDDWSRLSEVAIAGKQSINDAIGRLAMSQPSLNKALQNQLNELSLSKDLSSKYYGDAAIPNGYDEQGPSNNASIGGRYL